MNSKILRIHLRMPVAHWRIPFTQQNLHRTYPLPPPSTVLGMIHNLCGCKTGEVIKGIDIAIAGRYEFVFYQYQIFRNLYKDKKSAYKEAHRGGSMPNKVQLLGNVELYIYIKDEGACLEKKGEQENEFFDRIVDAFRNPSMPFILGRREDIAIVEDIKENIQLTEREMPLYTKIPLWVPEEKTEELGLHGVSYLLPTYYNLENGIRNFERNWYVYVESQPVDLNANDEIPKCLVDTVELEKENRKMKIQIPVVFLGIDVKKNSEDNDDAKGNTG